MKQSSFTKYISSFLPVPDQITIVCAPEFMSLWEMLHLILKKTKQKKPETLNFVLVAVGVHINHTAKVSIDPTC